MSTQAPSQTLPSTAVPFLDLKSYHKSLGPQAQRIWSDLLSSCAFVAGPQLREFESAFADFCEVRHAIGVASGTDALILAIRALGIGRGDEVITAANSFVATAEAIVLAGASPVFVDIDPHTYNLDVSRIESRINVRTKAILPVHLYGQPADMDPILRIARAHNLFVIEDASQAHGARYRGRSVGSLGDVACFSFYPGKNLGACGDGGAVVTPNETIAHSVRLLRDHGGVRKYQHEIIGCNSRLDTLQAAILLLKLQDLPERNEKRRSHAEEYRALLSGLPVALPEALPDSQGVFHLYVIRLERGERDQLQQFLADRNIQTGIHYPKVIPETPAFSGYKSHGDCPIAQGYSAQILSLPMFPELTCSQIEYIAHCMKEYFAVFK